MTNTTVTTTTGPAVVSRNKYGWPVVETLDWKVLLVKRTLGRDRRSYDSKVRAYSAFPVFVPGFNALETELILAANARDPEVKCPILAKFHRDSKKMVREGIQGVLPTLKEALEEAGHPVSLPALDEWKFSLKAGCSCGCSPGFIGNSRVFVDGYPCDLHFLDPDESTALTD